MVRQNSSESMRAGLLESSEYFIGADEEEQTPLSPGESGNMKHLAYPPRGLFDDV